MIEFLLARSEITCHLIITCQKRLHSVAQHNIFDSALTSHECLAASTCKERNKNWMRQTLEYTSSATAVPLDYGTVPCIKVAALCYLYPILFFDVLISGPDRVTVIIKLN
jgi:hypothetical protein